MPTFFYVSYALLWAVVSLLFGLVLLLYRHVGLQAMGTGAAFQRDGLAIGEKAKTFSGVTPDGTDVVWTPTAGRMTLLLFASLHCEPCRGVLPYAEHLAAVTEGADDFEVVTVTAGPGQEAGELLAHIPASIVLAEDGSGASMDWKVRATPFAFLIGTDGVVHTKGLCNSLETMLALLKGGGAAEFAALLERGSRIVGESPRVYAIDGTRD